MTSSEWIEGGYDKNGYADISDLPELVYYLIEPLSYVTSWNYKATCGPSYSIPVLVRSLEAYAENDKYESLGKIRWFWIALPDPPEFDESTERSLIRVDK